jgi:hypothetical protein
VEIVVKVTQNWSLEAKIHVCWNGKKMAPDLHSSGPDFLRLLEAYCSGKIGARFCMQYFSETYFHGPDLFQFYGSYFYYKYRHCINVDLR